MGILRLYPEKNNTIASSVYSAYNSGQNAVTDLWYGGGDSGGSPQQRQSLSRYIVNFDISRLQEKISNVEINTALTITYKLKIKNAIPRDRVLETEYEYDKLQKAIAASYDLICFPINKDWDEGRGYDLVEEFYTIKQTGNPLITGYSNWYSATTISSWDEPGIFTNPTASTSMNAIQHFTIGDEDIDMDVTDIVSDWLSGGSENYGVGVAFARPYELLTTATRYVASFFTSKTNTTFKPYIEASYNQKIMDDRKNVTNNRTSRLFLYTFSANTAVNYFSASTVTVKTAAGVTVSAYSAVTPTQLEKGVYYIDVLMNTAIVGQKYKDIWSGVTFVSGVDQQDITQEFQIQNDYYTSNTPSVNDYSFSTYGLANNSILTTEEVVRIFCDLRQNYSNDPPSTAYEVQYRMIQNNQIEVIPWTSVNQTVLSNCSLNYFDLDVSWLLHNQTYRIEFKIIELGSNRMLPNTIIFKVQRPF